jgi:uncharacterized protein YraI
MLVISHRLLRGLTLVLTALLCSALLAPTSVFSQSGVTAGGTATIGNANGDAVRLRTEPTYNGEILALFPEGTRVDIIDGPLTADDGSVWFSVTVDTMAGYMVADFLIAGPEADGGEQVGDLASDGTNPPASETASGGIGTAVTTAPLNFRAGPSTADGILAVIPAGTSVTLTGESANGFLSVSYNGINGWAYGDFLDTSGNPAAAEPVPAPSTTGTALTTAPLNLRNGASLSATVIQVMPAGATVSITSAGQSGFLPVVYAGQSGWTSADFLSLGGDPGSNPEPGGGGSGIVWPVSGGTWQIIQGYNGGTHQNRSASAQYYYALDIARVDGETAGQTVFAPASGSIRWVDPGSGGIAIDMGNGYVIAMFHCTFDPSLRSGQPVQQGQVLGTISGPGGNGYASTPHIDMTLWQSSDGARSRSATPFMGGNAVSGMSFTDTGGANQHSGTRFNP